MGTNDLTPKNECLWYRQKGIGSMANIRLPAHTRTPVSSIKERFKSLLSAIREDIPNIFILASAILPRPFDLGENKDHLVEANNSLKAFCEDFTFCEYLPSYTPVMFQGKPRHTHFDKGGLHLSQTGSLTLQRFFASHLVNTI